MNVTSITEKKDPKDSLLKYYELERKEYHHLDWLYVQITVIYNTLIGIYIVKLEEIQISSLLLAPLIIALAIIVSGIIFRTRVLQNDAFERIRWVQEKLGIEVDKLTPDRPEGRFFQFGNKHLGRYRTSGFLLALVLVVSLFAVIATFLKGSATHGDASIKVLPCVSGTGAAIWQE